MNDTEKQTLILFGGCMAIAFLLFIVSLIFPELAESPSNTTTHSYSRTHAIENMLRSNNPEISDDRIKSSSKRIEYEWNKATK